MRFSGRIKCVGILFGYIQNSIYGNFGGRRIGFANRRRELLSS